MPRKTKKDPIDEIDIEKEADRFLRLLAKVEELKRVFEAKGIPF